MNHCGAIGDCMNSMLEEASKVRQETSEILILFYMNFIPKVLNYYHAQAKSTSLATEECFIFSVWIYFKKKLLCYFTLGALFFFICQNTAIIKEKIKQTMVRVTNAKKNLKTASLFPRKTPDAVTLFSGCANKLASESKSQSLQQTGILRITRATKAITLCTAKQLPHDFMRAMLIYECNQLQPNAP